MIIMILFLLSSIIAMFTGYMVIGLVLLTIATLIAISRYLTNKSGDYNITYSE